MAELIRVYVISQYHVTVIIELWVFEADQISAPGILGLGDVR